MTSSIFHVNTLQTAELYELLLYQYTIIQTLELQRMTEIIFSEHTHFTGVKTKSPKG